MDATEHIEAYYDSLRNGEPLAPFFADSEDLVKIGISERLVGYDQVEAALRSQTNNTHEWTVESQDLRVTEQEDCAWFNDAVRMEWTNTTSGSRQHFDARWSGTLVPLEEADGDWKFVEMHVSAPHDL